MKAPRKILIGTRNAHKTREITAMLAGLRAHFLSLADFPSLPPVEEDQPSFEANALKKAIAWSLGSGLAVLSDDSGLEVDALDGAPGVLSARFSGGGDRANNALLLKKLENVPAHRRTARFRCAVALAVPGDAPLTAAGTVEGTILFKPKGRGGFGYDPLFLPLGYSQSFAEIPAREKNGMSHRARALKNLQARLAELWGNDFVKGEV